MLKQEKLSHNKILVIGNGESRRDIDIDSLDHIKIGCNAVIRDHTVDHLICVDKRMVNEALEKNINDTTKIYTRTDWHFNLGKNNLFAVPNIPYTGITRADEPFHWGSGPYAVLLAAQLGQNIYMLGFDLYSKDRSVNNLYKDTKGYDSSDKRAVDPRYWIHQIGNVFKYHPSCNFTIYQEPNWEAPESWFYPNVFVDNISNIM